MATPIVGSEPATAAGVFRCFDAVGVDANPDLPIWLTSDGQFLFYYRQDGHTRVWDLAAGVEPHLLSRAPIPGVAPRDHARLLGITACGKDRHLAVVLVGPAARIWCVESGELVAEVAEKITAGAVNPDGTLVLASEDGTVVLWDLLSGTRRLQWKAHAVRVTHVAGSLSAIVTAGLDRTLKRWDLNGSPLGDLPSQKKTICALEADSKGELIAVAWAGFWGRFVTVVRATGEPICRVKHNSVRSLSFSPSGDWLAVAGENDLRLVELSRGAAVHRQRFNFGRSLVSAAFSRDGEITAAVIHSEPHEDALRVEKRAPDTWSKPRLLTRPSFRYALAVDGHVGVSVRFVGPLCTQARWDLVSGTLISESRTLNPVGDHSFHAFNTRHSLLAVATVGDVTVLTLPALEPVRRFDSKKTVAIALGRTRLAVAEDGLLSSSVTVFDVFAGTKPCTFAVDSSVRSMAMSDDDAQIFTGTSKGKLDAWDVCNGRRLRTFTRDVDGLSKLLGQNSAHEGSINALLPISSGNRLVAGGGLVFGSGYNRGCGLQMSLWDYASGRLLSAVEVPGLLVTAMATASDGAVVYATVKDYRYAGPGKTWPDYNSIVRWCPGEHELKIVPGSLCDDLPRACRDEMVGVSLLVSGDGRWLLSNVGCMRIPSA
jgi:WD40 repeat protein